MDPNEFEHPISTIDASQQYDTDVEFVVEQLAHIAHAAGRYDRAAQLPIAIAIVNRLKAM